MRFYTNQHPLYCGIDLHARSMYVCILSHNGEILLHRNLKAAPDPFLKAIAPYRDGLVVAVECIFPWYWLADLCADQGIPFVLGHALSMQALHGGKAKNDKIDSQKIAVLLRGGMFPKAYVYPAERRATRDLLRRRTHLRHTRAALLSHVQNTNSQYNLPEIGKKIAYKANREGVAERFDASAVHKTIEVALALITYYEELLKDEANTLSLLQTVPGIGTILSLVLLYDIHRIERLPRVQEFASSCRLIKCSKASGGKRLGTSGHTIGHAHLTWAFGEAAALFLRTNEAGQKYLARLEKTHDKGKALSSLAHKRARAVYSMLKRKVAFDMDILLRRCGSRAAEPEAELDTPGDEPAASPPAGLLDGVGERHGVPRPGIPEPAALIGQPLWLWHMRRWSSKVAWAAPPPSLTANWRVKTLSQPCA